MLDEVEAPLRVPSGFEIVTCSPAAEALDPSNIASDSMLGVGIMVRFEHFGWCKGKITGKNVDRRRTINRDQINFTAEFDIDDGASTDLSLELATYTTPLRLRSTSPGCCSSRLARRELLRPVRGEPAWRETEPPSRRFEVAWWAAFRPFRERSERWGPERVPGTFRMGWKERSRHLRTSRYRKPNPHVLGKHNKPSALPLAPAS